MSDNIVILGAGLAGLSAAYHLNKINYAIFEKEEEPGGLVRSKSLKGFTFDYDGHLLHFKNNYTLELVIRLLDGNLAPHKRNSWIFSKGTYTRYPFQANSFGLPKEIVRECLLGVVKTKLDSEKFKEVAEKVFFNADPRSSTEFIPSEVEGLGILRGILSKAKDKSNADSRRCHCESRHRRCRDEAISSNGANFENWIYKTFGEGIAKHFMIPYNKKFWTVEPKELTCEWLDGFVPVPSLEDVISGAISDNPKPFGYNARFWYPIKGGISEVSKAFLKNIQNLYLKKEVIKIDIKNKLLSFSDGSSINYKRLINTLPLPELPKLIDDLPEKTLENFKKLKWTSIFVLNLGIKRDRVSEKHWIYFPEEDFIFYRVGFPMNFSPALVPPGCSSLYAEVAYSEQKPLKKEGLQERIIEDLKRARIIQERDRLIVKYPIDIKYAYIIYDSNYSKSTSQILNFLKDLNIHSIGRFGSWRYLSMEDVILQAKELTNYV